MDHTFMKKRILPLATALVLGALVMEANAQIYGYWQDQNGAMIRSGTGTCVRTGNWTPELATAECDPELVPQKTAAAQDPTDSQPETRAAAPVTEKTIVTPDTLFDSGQAVIKPSGKATLDELIAKLQGNNSVVIPIGYASSPGSEDYNMKLSERRAEAVKDYLVSQGVDDSRIYIANKGEQNPVADNDTSEGRAQNRRVEIEVMATPPVE